MKNPIGISKIGTSAYRCMVMALLLLICTLSSCKHSDNFNNREYTKGVYKDFNLHKEKSDKGVSGDSLSCDGKRIKLLEKVEVAELPALKQIHVVASPERTNEIFHEEYPLIAERMDSILAKQMGRDSSWIGDTAMPECVATAFSTQAMLGVGTVGGLVTIAAPEFIWFSIIGMIAAPLMLLISLIAAAIAMAKINTGEIDVKYKRAMRLWALCLLVNLVIGSIVLLHFTSL